MICSVNRVTDIIWSIFLKLIACNFLLHIPVRALFFSGRCIIPLYKRVIYTILFDTKCYCIMNFSHLGIKSTWTMTELVKKVESFRHYSAPQDKIHVDYDRASEKS